MLFDHEYSLKKESLNIFWEPPLEYTLHDEESSLKNVNFHVKGGEMCQASIIAIVHIKSLALGLPDLVLLAIVALVLVSFISFPSRESISEFKNSVRTFD